MFFRKALLATTMLMVPLAVRAQAPSEPVTGPYVGAAGGFNVKSNPNINNLTGNRPGGRWCGDAQRQPVDRDWRSL